MMAWDAVLVRHTEADLLKPLHSAAFGWIKITIIVKK